MAKFSYASKHFLKNQIAIQKEANSIYSWYVQVEITSLSLIKPGLTNSKTPQHLRTLVTYNVFLGYFRRGWEL